MPPAAPTILELSDDLLDELYDDGAVERGEGYADEDRVRLLESKAGLIRSVCKGTGRATYLVRIRWHDVGGGVYLDDECSCPLGGQCKHCVATLIVARRTARLAELEASLPRLGPGPRHRPGTHPTGGGTGSGYGYPRPPDWRDQLRDLPTADRRAAPPEVRALAIELSIRRARYLSAAPTLELTPRRSAHRGGWAKSGASWREVVRRYDGSVALEPKQRSALRAVAATASSTAFDSDLSPTLGDFGADLWPFLHQAIEAGVELISAEPGQEVVLERLPATVSVDLAEQADGSVVLSAELLVADQAADSLGDEVGLAGTPLHGIWAATPERLRLIELEAPVHQALARLALGKPLLVPPDDVDELLDRYVPSLAALGAVGSADGTVTVEANRFAGLVLTVERPTLDSAILRWSARYRRGERTTDHRLDTVPALTRDLDAEASALAALELPVHALPFMADHRGDPRELHLDGLDLLTLFDEAIPWLEERGQVTVEVLGDQPALRSATEDPVIAVAVRDGSGDANKDGNDWFDLDVTITVDGEDVAFVPLFAALHRRDPFLILPSGTVLRLDRPEFAKLRALLDEARGLAEPDGDATARVNRFQAAWWDELVQLGVVAEQSERWATSVAQMRELDAPEPLPVPAGLQATLRPYQEEGFAWLGFLHRNGLGGILADDMGLGKTVQTLALCLHIHERQPDARFLVVAPTSVVENWAREAARFAPQLAVRTIKETKARRGTALAEEIGGTTLVVTSYALFRLEFEAYAEHAWELLLLDEAQFVKNHQGKTHGCARRLPAATKVAITGTPLENTLMDLWSLLSITAPGLYPDPKRFDATYRKPIEAGTAPELLATLRNRIAPLMRRRTKDAVLTELPPKIEQTIEIELSAKHGRLYAAQLQRQRQKVLGLVGDVTKHRFEILKSLTLLRQLALDPALVDEEHEAIGSAKLDRLLDDLTQVLAEGHRALVFSQFTRFLKRARDRLDAAGIAYAYLDGSTRDREAAITRFKDGDAPVFLISLKAGGFGLNLTEADYCFVLDPWWNPATETQAVDRAHRIGQEHPVVVYRYVSAETIEEKVMELKARKSRLFDTVVGEEAELDGALTEADIRGLLDLDGA